MLASTEFAERLDELKAANLPVATMESLGITASSEDEAVVADATARLNEYFAHFLAPDKDGKCVCCGTVQGGIVSALIGGGFTYDITHGEGHCATCGYPARTHHYIADVADLTGIILQYHPGGFAKKEAE